MEAVSFLKTLVPVYKITCDYVGQVSSVGVATHYGLNGPGIESRWGKIFCTCPDRPWGPPSLLYSGYQVFPRGKMAGAGC